MYALMCIYKKQSSMQIHAVIGYRRYCHCLSNSTLMIPFHFASNTKRILVKLLLFILLLFVLTSSTGIALYTTNDTSCLPTAELNALQDLFISTNGNSWQWKPLSNGNIWNFTVNPDPCGDNWQGVFCLNKNSTGVCSIYELDLNTYNLQGYISNSINNLTKLEYIDLSNNNITGSMPPELGDCMLLQVLDLHSNILTGSLPVQWSNLTQLFYLDLHDNIITGSMPLEYGYLSQLEYIILYSNMLQGRLPDTINNLMNLLYLDIKNNYINSYNINNLVNIEYVDMNNNELTGSIHINWYNLSHLRYLDLSSNLINGTIPKQLKYLSILEYLNLGNNHMTGTIPAILCNLNTLLYIDLSNNYISHTIPSTINNLTLLEYLYIDNNYITSSIPLELFLLSKLEYLYIDNNYITSSIPVGLYNLSSILYIDLSINTITSSIPYNLYTLNTLLYLDLDNNMLTGSINNSIQTLHSLQYLYLSDNHLTGTLPTGLNQLYNLLDLDIDDNHLFGNLNLVLRNLTSLEYLDLNNNLLTSSMPVEITSLYSIQSLLLQNNFLTGQIPGNMSNLRYLQFLYLDRNSLTGAIPTGIYELYSLIYCDLHINMLTSSISIQINNLQELEYFDISSNYITSTIPLEIGDLDELLYLDAYNNLITGSIPSSIGLLQQLYYLYLDNNLMIGTLPIELGNLLELEYLIIGTNGFTGTVPSALGKLLQLEGLDLSFTALTGSIPKELCELSSLYSLTMNNAALSGSIPESLGGLSRVLLLDLSYNKLTGSIPTSIDQLAALWDVDMSYNALTGSLPQTLSQLHRLESLILSANQLTGPLFNITALPNLFQLVASDNHFTGTLPINIGTVTSITSLNLTNNKMHGSLPRGLGQLHALEVLSLSGNHFSGPLPSALSALSNLYDLDVSRNALTGSLTHVFNASKQVHLSTVVLGNNSFTGPLPDALFHLPSIVGVSIFSTCLTGILPDSVCSSDGTLQYLTLNGLHTAASCRRTVWSSAISKAYTTSTAFSGSVPPCVYTMPYLSSLQLSGNSLTGTLPHTVSDSLADLTLSHNQLTGTLPHSLQTHVWLSLDLSYNRLTGHLGDFNTSFQNSTTIAASQPLYLSNNRLSGHIPTSLVHRQDVQVLQSNLFTCQTDKSDLPSSDSNKATYHCGSQAFNGPYFAFLGVIVAVSLVVSVIVYNVLSSAWIRSAVALVQQWGLHLQQPLPPSLRYFIDTNNALVHISVLCTMLIIVILLPWYAIASQYYGTYQDQYAWVVSAAFLSGLPPTLTELFLFMALLLVFVTYALSIFWKQGTEHTQQVPIATVGQTVRAPFWQRLGVYLIVLSVNIGAVLGVNIAYIVAALKLQSDLLFITQVALSLFKLFWNTRCAPYLINRAALYFNKTKRRSTGLVMVQLCAALINNIAIPCIVVAMLSPLCFYSLFDTPAPVQSTYEVTRCFSNSTNVVCTRNVPLVLESSYTAPFSYSYQCSSAFITFYAPMFMYLAITASFITPLYYILALYRLHQCGSNNTTGRYVQYTLPLLLIPEVCLDVLGTSKTPRSRILTADSELVNMLTYLGILLTFGVVFPPLAVAMCITMLSVSWQTKLAVGRFLCEAERLQAPRLQVAIDQDCHRAVSVQRLRKALYVIVSVCCSFYALFLFDTLGDAVGLGRAYWVLIVMPLFPVCMYICYVLYVQWQTRSSVTLSDRMSSSGEGVELPVTCAAVVNRQDQQETDNIQMEAGLNDEKTHTTTMNILQQRPG